MTQPNLIRCALGVLVLLPSLALANIGTVASLEGAAMRTPRGGAAVPLKEGSDIELGDILEVASGNLAVTLNDKSSLMLAAGSRLEIEDARFEGLERKAFSARLFVGTLWAKVSKAIAGDATNFEVKTDRAVAGVRGTTFVVEVEGLEEHATHVQVLEGRVDVREVERALALGLTNGEPATNRRPVAARIEALAAGEGLALRARGIEREKVRALPERFERFIRTHERALLRDLKPAQEPRQLERIRERMNGAGPGRRRP